MSAAGKREAKSRKTPGRAGLQEAARSRYRAEAARKERERAARAPHWSANLGQQGQSVPSSQGSPRPSPPLGAAGRLVKDHPGHVWVYGLPPRLSSVGPPLEFRVSLMGRQGCLEAGQGLDLSCAH